MLAENLFGSEEIRVQGGTYWNDTQQLQMWRMGCTDNDDIVTDAYTPKV